MAALATVGVVLALRLWPAAEPGAVPHAHPDLPPDHPDLKAHGAAEHWHEPVIDDLHQRWPGPRNGIA